MMPPQARIFSKQGLVVASAKRIPRRGAVGLEDFQRVADKFVGENLNLATSNYHTPRHCDHVLAALGCAYVSPTITRIARWTGGSPECSVARQTWDRKQYVVDLLRPVGRRRRGRFYDERIAMMEWAQMEPNIGHGRARFAGMWRLWWDSPAVRRRPVRRRDEIWTNTPHPRNVGRCSRSTSSQNTVSSQYANNAARVRAFSAVPRV